MPCFFQIRIGRHGSCAQIGVVATDDIARGECLAVIPRRVLLSCSNSDIAGLVLQERQLMEPTTSSWVPLLIALAAECTKKVIIVCQVYQSALLGFTVLHSTSEID